MNVASGFSRTTAVVAYLVTAACRPYAGPATVSVRFENSWKLGGVALTADEQERVRAKALDTLRAAFHGFDVRFVHGKASHRIVVENTPYSSPMYLGSVGVTGTLATSSSVRIDSLFAAELSVLHCESLATCAAKSRPAIIDGLGVGVGATAAHELGHQRGLEFTRHSACDDCYDSSRSTSYAHFFGAKHWSEGALTRMRAVLR